MFRLTSLLRTTARRVVAAPRVAFVASPARFAPLHTGIFRLADATPAPLQSNEVTERVLAVVKKFEKIKDASAVTATSTFAADLGLDSLDAVEVVMAFEDEFGIEIPDADADKILSTADAIKYIVAHPKAQ